MRRLLTLLLLAASLGLVARGAVPCETLSAQPACTAALLPGPARTTFPSVQIVGQPTYASTGELVLTTVSVDINIDLGEWIRNGLDPRVDQTPRSLFILPDEDPEDADERNRIAMDQSQLVASVAALRNLGFEAPAGAEVVEVVDGSAAAAADLQVGDVIVGLGDTRIDSPATLVDAVRSRTVGDQVSVTYRRDGQERTVDAVLDGLPAGDHGEAGDGPSLGVQVRAALPVDVTIDAGEIGGPSAGLMYALTIVDLLGEEDLTGGRVIAGTGTITADGEVGPIGGIRQKILGALDRGEGARPAEVFLVPAGNFEEARTAPVEDERILLVPVATLQEALDALDELRAGREPASALALGG